MDIAVSNFFANCILKKYFPVYSHAIIMNIVENVLILFNCDRSIDIPRMMLYSCNNVRTYLFADIFREYRHLTYVNLCTFSYSTCSSHHNCLYNYSVTGTHSMCSKYTSFALNMQHIFLNKMVYCTEKYVGNYSTIACTVNSSKI